MARMRVWCVFLSLVGILAGPCGMSVALAAPLRILALGDSLTQGYGVKAGFDFPAQLQKALRAKGHDVEIINGGTSGDTSAGGLAALTWTFNAPPTQWPDGVIVELGANDALRGLLPANTEKNLSDILAQLKARKVPVLLAGMKAPRNMGETYIKAFDAVYPRLAKKHGVLFYPFFLEGVAVNAKLNQPDMMHPNADGVAEIVKRIVPDVEKLLAQAKARKR